MDIKSVLNSFFIVGIEFILLRGLITLKILMALKFGTPGSKFI
jgi:hypothetical protein